MIGLFLASLASAQAPPILQLQSTGEIRHDLFGERLVPFNQYARLEYVGDNGIGVHGNVGGQWMAGLENPVNPDLYTLNVDRTTLWGEWSVGRQQAISALRIQTFDGVNLHYTASPSLSFTAWGGVARHHDLDDLRDGVGIGRAEANYRRGGLSVRAGFQGESGPNSATILREDLELWYRAATRKRPQVGARVVFSQPGILEWLRGELGFRPVSTIGIDLYSQHRKVIDTGALFGDRLLDALSGGQVQEVGGRVSYLGAGFATVTAQYALATYGRLGSAQYGHRIDLRWTPPRRMGRASVLPAYAFRSGPGGMYHALYTTLQWRIDDRTRLSARGAVVPFRKQRAPWDLAANLRIEGFRELYEAARLSIHVDTATDRLFDIDVRAGATVWLEIR